MSTDLELLQVEIDTQWVSGEDGRLLHTRERDGEPAPDVVVAVAASGSVALAFGAGLPDEIVRSARQAVGRAGSDVGASVPAPAETVRTLLGPAEVSSGPCWQIPAGTGFTSAARVVASGDTHAAAALGSVPPAAGGFSAAGWGRLAAGSAGPWAAALVGERVVALCHSARLADHGAEAGVWTDPDFRGNGHAAAVTAAWAAQLAGTGRHLFYSTDAHNVSSQRVAARLGLRPIGAMWSIRRRSGSGQPPGG